MHLLEVQITKYKSIDDSGVVDIDDVTCLVGKNEAGKTAFLRALTKLNPVEGTSAKFDPLLEYPAKEYSAYKSTHDVQPARVLHVVLEMTDEEIEKTEATFAKGLLQSKKIVITKGYNNKSIVTVDFDESVMVREIISKAQMPPDIADKALVYKDIPKLAGYLETLQDIPPSVENFIELLKNNYKKSLYQQMIDYIWQFLPVFVYFDDYSILEGRIVLQDLEERIKAQQLSDADHTFLALLGVAGLEIDDLKDQSNYLRIKRELETASNRITDDVFKFWSQNTDLEVEFDLHTTPLDPNKNTRFETTLHVNIKNRRHRVTVPFDERSRGFVWFFSFLVYFSQIEDKGHNLVLLLDEPGLSLHAKAQGDFLRFIDEQLATRHQVIYTTHSPFLINPQQLNRVRTVEDILGEGTVVSNNALLKDRDTIFPLQAALGYELAQTLFVGPNMLLVEGPSDLIYLQILSTEVENTGSEPLDERWVVAPVRGADNLSTFVTLIGANNLNVAVLRDTSGSDQQKIRQLANNGYLKQGNLVLLNEITKKQDAAIEDIFDPAFYVEIVNRTFVNDLSIPIKVELLPASDKSIVTRIRAYFRQHNIRDGKFDHYRPSVYLLEHQTELLSKLDKASLDRANQLIERINNLLPIRRKR